MYGIVYEFKFTNARGLRMDVALIRAFGDEPRKLKASWDGEAVRVFGPEGDDWIPYPSAYVFEFEEELFDDLAAAFGRGDRSKLIALWQRARPLKQSTH